MLTNDVDGKQEQFVFMNSVAGGIRLRRNTANSNNARVSRWRVRPRIGHWVVWHFEGLSRYVGVVWCVRFRIVSTITVITVYTPSIFRKIIFFFFFHMTHVLSILVLRFYDNRNMRLIFDVIWSCTPNVIVELTSRLIKYKCLENAS